ncbi:hypothetical protein [Variovorax sp. Sphag1AA]|uniref:hypothetical protein n=1 Tax=Variovorax sp. Sphag1AA TaxID=2587027 RepID=UPI00160E5942|nr:hypothetical protein [Variovorax sp. Sphag1AA]MBB3178414.1 hypothetical protein [Variovorax sp. Sphag1AA]
MKKIELRIDRLVIDATSGPALNREQLAHAVSQALAQRIDTQRAPASGQRIEHRIAAAVHQAIPGTSRGGQS